MALDMYGRMTGPARWMMTSRWDWPHLILLFSMWAAMMVAMMLPTMAPVFLEQAKHIREEREPQRPAIRLAAFAAGYVLVWTLFSVGATVAQRMITEAQLMTAMMEPARPAFVGGVLLIAGFYQLLPFKRRCLSSCRSCAALAAHRRPGAIGAFCVGLQYGISCLACCWVLMLILFAGGVMNLAVIVALTVLVLFEKLTPFGMRSTLISGSALMGLGLWVIVR